MNIEVWGIVIQAAAATATFLAVAAAIWGERIKAFLMPAQLTIEKHNFVGSLTKLNSGERVFYYHLIVRNHRRWKPAKNCRVLLKHVTRLAANGSYRPAAFFVPQQLQWSPYQNTPPLVTVSNEQVLDLGFLVEGTAAFQPALYLYPNNFQGFVGKHESVRYYLEALSDDSVPKTHKIIQVAWDGIWTTDQEEMSRHLVIGEADSL